MRMPKARLCVAKRRAQFSPCYNMSGIVPRPLIRSGYETNEKPNGYVWADRPSDDVN